MCLFLADPLPAVVHMVLHRGHQVQQHPNDHRRKVKCNYFIKFLKCGIHAIFHYFSAEAGMPIARIKLSSFIVHFGCIVGAYHVVFLAKDKILEA